MPRNVLFGFVLLAITTTSGCIIVDDGDSDFTVFNDSSYVLTEVRLAEVSDPNWGPNLLPQPLFPGDSVTVSNIECGNWDIMVVDNTGVDCVLGDVDLCFDSDGWSVDNTTLDICAFN
jgi:hypothetical protein